MKNVLFIVYYFPPMGGSGVQRPLKFIKYLREFGWNPIVLCPEPGMYPYFDESLNQELQKISPEITRIHPNTLFHAGGRKSNKQKRIPDFAAKFIRRILRFFMYPDNKKGWITPAVENGLKIIGQRNIEMIFSTAPPFSNHIIGKELKKRTGKPLIVDYRDAWLNNHFMNGMFKWQKKIMYRLEHECLQYADAVLTLDKEMLKGMKNHFRIKKANVLPHGFDPEDFEGKEESVLRYKKGKLNFLYSGIFYENNQPDLFLKALSLAIEKEFIPKNQIHLHFQGGLDSRIQRLIRKLNFEHLITDYGYLTHSQSVANLCEADVLWMISNFDSSYKQVKSGKLFEYFGARKPVLGLIHTSGAEADLLRQYGAGFIGDVESPEKIADVLKIIFQKWQKGEDINVNTGFVDSFNRKKLTGKLAHIFNEISFHN